jgi:hypothetical protein
MLEGWSRSVSYAQPYRGWCKRWLVTGRHQQMGAKCVFKLISFVLTFPEAAKVLQEL